MSRRAWAEIVYGGLHGYNEPGIASWPSLHGETEVGPCLRARQKSPRLLGIVVNEPAVTTRKSCAGAWRPSPNSAIRRPPYGSWQNGSRSATTTSTSDTV